MLYYIIFDVVAGENNFNNIIIQLSRYSKKFFIIHIVISLLL